MVHAISPIKSASAGTNQKYEKNKTISLPIDVVSIVDGSISLYLKRGQLSMCYAGCVCLIEANRTTLNAVEAPLGYLSDL